MSYMRLMFGIDRSCKIHPSNQNYISKKDEGHQEDGYDTQRICKHWAGGRVCGKGNRELQLRWLGHITRMGDKRPTKKNMLDKTPFMMYFPLCYFANGEYPIISKVKICSLIHNVLWHLLSISSGLLRTKSYKL